MHKISRAVIPAAGRGRRMLPLTRAVPKEMVLILDVPAIQFAVEEALLAGATDIIIVTGPGKSAIEDYFSPWPEWLRRLPAQDRPESLERLARVLEQASVRFVRQERPGGLGQAVALTREHVGDEPFAVLLPDVVTDAEPPCLSQLLSVWRVVARGETLIGVHEVPEEETHHYGIVRPGGERRVADLVEKPQPGAAPSTLAITGRYILHPDIFAALEATAPGTDGELQLTDALRLLLQRRPVYWSTFAGRPYDVGQVSGWLQANVAFARERPDLARHLAYGGGRKATARGYSLPSRFRARVAAANGQSGRSRR